MATVAALHSIHSRTWSDEIVTYRGERKTLRQVAFGNRDLPDKILGIERFHIPPKSPFLTISLDTLLSMYCDFQSKPTFVDFCAQYKITLTGRQLARMLPNWISDKTCPLCSSVLLVRINTRANIIGDGRTSPFRCPVCNFVEYADGSHPFSCECAECNTPGGNSERQRWLLRKPLTSRAESQPRPKNSQDGFADIERENLALKSALALVSPDSGKAFADLLQGYIFDKMRCEDVQTLLALLDRKLTLSEAEAALGVKRL